MNHYDPRYMQLQQEKLENIIRKKQSVSSASKELSVSRKTMYQWLYRYKQYGIDGLLPKKRKKGSVAHNRTCEDVEQRIISLAKDYYTEGVESLSDLLYDEHEITLHPTTVYRILKRNGVRYGQYHIATKKRWKKKLYAHKTPGSELQIDTTYPYGYKAGKVIYTAIDDSSRTVFTKAYDKANAMRSIAFLKELKKHTPFTIQKIRMDNGREFKNTKVQEYLTKENVAIRYNTPYCPEQNGKIERFHQTLKRAYAYGLSYNSTIDELNYRLTLFTQFYNYKKRHRGLGMNGLTPIQKLEEYALSTDAEKSVTLTLQCNKY